VKFSKNKKNKIKLDNNNNKSLPIAKQALKLFCQMNLQWRHRSSRSSNLY